MSKYLQVAKNTIQEMTAYRTSFILYRSRNIMQFLTMYFLWIAVIPENGSLGGYDRTQMITYIFMTFFVSAFAWATRTQQIGEDINQGVLSNFLLKPIGYFKYWFARDMGDKTMNTMFGIIEFGLLFFIFRPPFFFQTDARYLLLFFIAVIIAMFNYFFISIMLGLIGFWSRDIWAPRFIFYSLLLFFSGGVFPLDLLPEQIHTVFQLLPFTYLLYFPIKVYLGQLPIPEILTGMVIACIWMLLLYRLTAMLWLKGLKSYTAYGH